MVREFLLPKYGAICSLGSYIISKFVILIRHIELLVPKFHGAGGGGGVMIDRGCG